MSDYNDSYLDLSNFGGNGEELPDGPLKSAGFKQTKPGEYISNRREIKAKRIEAGQYAGHLEFQVTLVGGVQDEGGRIHNEKFPLTKKLTTIPFKTQDGVDDSSVAQYLRAFGYKPAGFNLEQTISSMQETQNIPCKVFISRTDKSVKSEVDGKVVWTSANLRLKDFLSGAAPDGTPIYLDEVTIEGKVYQAKPIVGSFSRL